MALYPKVEEVEPGRVSATFEPQPEHRGNPGWLQGGLAATVLDHVSARAASSALGRRVVTGTLDLRYPKPVPLDGGPYRVEARALPRTAGPEARRALVGRVRVEAAIVGADDRPLVRSKGLFIALPGDAAAP